MRTTCKLALILAFAPLACSLKAEGMVYQCQAQVCFAQGGLKTLAGSRLGYDVGVNGLYALADGEASAQLRPRVDLTLYPMFKFSDIQVPASSLSVGCDYLRYLPIASNAFYAVGGLALVRWSAFNSGSSVKATSPSNTKLGFALGMGYKASDTMSYEIRYSFAPLTGYAQSRTLGVGITMRF